MRCGLFGHPLGHTYSPAIHAQLGDYHYEVFDTPPEKLDAFLKKGDWDGLNVTIPYKKAVIPYCQALSPMAAKTGSVNVLVRRKDGTLYGDNTDAFGFSWMIRQGGMVIAGKKAVVLGNGGVSPTVCAVLEEMGAASIAVISRRGEDNYENLSRHADAQILVNTTPVGMYPGNGTSAVDLREFPRCEGVLELIYNPARTALMMQAQALGIPAVGGLGMLVAQAKKAAELFTGKTLEKERIHRITADLAFRMGNLILIGMPGCGKTTVARALAARLGRKAEDCDQWVECHAGTDIPSIFAREGEAGFRRWESQAIQDLGKCSGIVLATGGGCVEREENYFPLHQNGTIFCLRRDLDLLPREGRPVSQSSDMEALARRREPLYQRFADYTIDNNGPVEETVNHILEVMGCAF